MSEENLVCDYFEISMTDIARAAATKSGLELMLKAIFHKEGCPMIVNEKTGHPEYDPDWDRKAVPTPFGIAFRWQHKDFRTEEQ